MLISDLTVEVRNSSLARVGQILPADLRGLELALRFNKAGAWRLVLRSDHPLADSLRAPGAGLIVTGPAGVILSGPTVSATNVKTSSDSTGTWEIVGTDDSVILGERLAYPTPTSSDLDAQIDAYDTRTGPAETVAKAYVAANMGPTAPVARRVTGLTVDTDLGRGSTVTTNARFDRIGGLVSDVLAIDGLGFDIRQVGTGLVFEVFEPVDRSASIRMDVDNLRLSKSVYTYTAPAATRVIVAGQGEGAGRILLERVSTASTTAETAWGRRIEVFKDSRNTAETDALESAGDELLAGKGKTLEGIKATPSDDQTMAYGVDWGLGDKVTVVIGAEQIAQIVTEVAIVVTDDGIKVGATVGDPVSVGDPDTVALDASTSQEARISNLERNGTAGTQSVIQYVKNSTGAAMTKGQAVYILGATGSNITVGLAKADAEATSSKTLGLLAQDLANGEHGYVITEGTLDGLNTSGRTAGEPMWLSPTTAGAIVYGLAGKPSAPAHLVYLGVVKRVQSNNGSVFVKVQNGFELDELHNVSITSPTAGEALVYDSTNSLWKNGQATSQSDIPTGSIMSTALVTAPSGWLLCDGAAVSRTTYANLFGVIGTTYGAGNGTTTFNVPDLRGRVAVGRNSGTFATLGATGGAETHTLTNAQLPDIPINIRRFDGDANDYLGGSGNPYGITTPYTTGGTEYNIAQTRGGGGAHNNLQPYLVTNYIIKFTSAFVSTDSELAARIGAQETLNATTNRAGMVAIVPTSATNGTVGATGTVTFTGQTSISLNGAFTSAYTRYRVFVDFTTTNMTGTNTTWVLRSSGTNNTTSNYSYNGYRFMDWAPAQLNARTAAGWLFIDSNAQTGTSYVQGYTDIMYPQQTSRTFMSHVANLHGAGGFDGSTYLAGMWDGTTSFDGFTITFSASSTGTVKVYGYN
jgi:microcystin-dependent protein